MYRKNALRYFDVFGFNVLPLVGKRPIIEWDRWQNENQIAEDIEKMDWDSATGVGVISKDNLLVIDVDKIEDWDVRKLILEKLELPEDYEWIVKTGSGKGLQIYIKVDSFDDFVSKYGDKAVYKYQLKTDGLCDHIELRWKACQNVVPYSKHPEGGVYEFYGNEPMNHPVTVRGDLVTDFVAENCKTEIERSFKIGGLKPKYKKPRYDKVKLESAIDYLGANLPKGCYEEWYRIGFALVPLGDEGKEYFVRLSLANPNYNSTRAEVETKFNILTRDYDGRITLKRLYTIAESYGWEWPKVKFWFVSEDKVKISQVSFSQFLQECGFYKYFFDKDYSFILITDNVVEEVGPVHIRGYVKEYILNIPEEALEGVERFELLNALMKGNNIYFGQSSLEFLESINIVFNKDESDKSFLYFRNGFVEISRDAVKLKSYRELDGYIWKRQIINREYKPTKVRTDFEKLMMNICKKDVKRFNALKSAIGYLLHRYKDTTRAKAIVFLDEKLSDGAYGRSGKSLVAKAVGKLRKTLRIDGRNFKFGNTFAFQSITLDTDIIEFNDVDKKFQFGRLFAVITDDINVEKKNKDEMVIPFEDAPKVIISTNYSIEGVDDSTLDRQFVIEFSDFYNMRHTPIKDFRKRFFEEWNEAEWNAFDCFMIECLQYYLENGLVAYDYVNLTEKKLIDMTSVEFAEFVKDLKPNMDYDKKDLHKLFKEAYEDYDQQKQNTFTKWLKIYGNLYGLEVNESRQDKVYLIRFGLRKVA